PLLPALAGAGAFPTTYYSGPSDAPARDIALAYVADSAGELGLRPGDADDVAVTDVVTTRHNGLTHVYLRQRVQGLEIDGAEMGIHIDREGRILHRAGAFVPAVAERVAGQPSFPRLAPEEAVRAAADRLALPARDADLALVESAAGTDRRTVFSSPELSEEEIPVRLRYFRIPGGDQLRLTWNLNLKVTGSTDWLDLWIDAATGDLVGQVNWTAEVDATYRIFASPKESPSDGGRTDEVDPHLAGGALPATGASPYGWHDTNGVIGPETDLTSGNNVNACTDTDANNACDPGSQPSGGTPPLVFQPALDLATQQPADYRDAAVVNLYYWNNIIHDISYQYGFDEVAGNFQQNNYGRGGLGSDSVRAEAQDGSGVNNANFGTPPDGSQPRMQMYVWTNPFSQFVTVTAPAGIAASYIANPSNNGGTGMGLSADMALVVDGTPPTNDACEAVTNDLTGKIALIVWSGGLCNSSVFVANAAAAGAVAAVIVDDTVEPRTNFGGNAAIPSVAVGSTDGQLFVTTLAGDPIAATLEDNPDGQINRDSDLDAGVIVHEYGHGISNRLTGGPATASCLGNTEQMGEGWSDWQTLFLHAAVGDTATTPRPVGTYLDFDDPLTGAGIRHYPYNTDNAANPLTYGDIPGETVPHGVGAVWANMLWEMYWNLVGEFGYDPDLYYGTGGNNIAYQLVIDGMKLQPCNPGFVTGRDAILAADEANYDGDLACHIWNAFAERGVGTGANQGSSNAIGDETEDFTLPPVCANLIFADSFGFGFARWDVHP
ncbi:MAG: M36 family metallopeptidase, partial [Acidobacteria bacterium]|nr:M36 family metallopeptidase [Acidobacteriota bacterium]